MPPKRPWLSRVLLLLVALAAAGWVFLQRNARDQTVSGTIEMDEIRVASRYGGRVKTIHAWDGDTLAAGALIAKLDAAELVPRRTRAAAQLAELEQGPRRREVETARREWEAQQAELQFARLDAERMQELFASKTISKTEYDRALSRAEALEKSVAAARERYELLCEGTRPERLDQARATLAEIDAQLEELTIRAPSNCVLEVLHVRVGDVLPPHREIATLLLPDRIWMRVFVPALWLGHIDVGQTVAVTVDAFPGREFSGRVEQINRAAEFTPRNVQTVSERVKQVFGVRVRLDPAHPELHPGMSANVRFLHVPAWPR